MGAAGRNSSGPADRNRRRAAAHPAPGVAGSTKAGIASARAAALGRVCAADSESARSHEPDSERRTNMDGGDSAGRPSSHFRAGMRRRGA